MLRALDFFLDCIIVSHSGGRSRLLGTVGGSEPLRRGHDVSRPHPRLFDVN